MGFRVFPILPFHCRTEKKRMPSRLAESESIRFQLAETESARFQLAETESARFRRVGSAISAN